MKLLVDENLPPRLVYNLADLFPDSLHVESAGLGSTSNLSIWEYAKARGFTFLTKDKDFANLSIACGAPPKVILLQTVNSWTAQVIQIIGSNATRFANFDSDSRRSLLILR